MPISKLNWNINFTNEAMDFINFTRILRSKEFINIEINFWYLDIDSPTY